MDANQTLGQLDLQSEIVAYAIIGIAVLLIVFFNRARLLRRFREWRLQRGLDRIGVEQIIDFTCPDGLDDFYTIERLALTPSAILLISYKPYDGHIYCAERIDEWTQVVGQKSFKFTNPLFELENQITALRLVIGNVPIRGVLFFGYGTVFPKGHPEAVLQLDSLPVEFSREPGRPVGDDLRAAWTLIKSRQTGASATAELGVKT